MFPDTSFWKALNSRHGWWRHKQHSQRSQSSCANET
ncbi:hypothetical protein PoMZ_00177 [Pyricularia oryzae]|uniref:Uncharacterized protein n=1 Tax=Pyricularia oryzae TaxID=318829 RepID=A0A4P7N2S7_PYROR|nr:hypothetical protein PoMZ_00177 [Pyricularia oryzae]